MYRVIAVFCALLVFAEGQTTNVTQCWFRPEGLPISAYVHGCINPPCLLPLQQDAVIDVVFRAPRNISELTTLAILIFDGGLIQSYDPVKLGEAANTCAFLTPPSSCPIQGGEIVQYRLRMHVYQDYALNRDRFLEVRIVDDDFVGIWCIRLPIKIVEPLQSVSITDEMRIQDQH